MHAERVCRQAGCLRMQTATEYRRFAEECERLAREAKAERHREILMEMADVWRKLAEESERRDAKKPR